MASNHVYKSSHINFASGNEHKGKIVRIDRTEFDKFAHKPTEEVRSPTVCNAAFLSDSIRREVHDEYTTFEPITFVSNQSIQEKELERTFGERYFEAHCNPRVFAVRLLMDELVYDTGYVIIQIHDEINGDFHPVLSDNIHVKVSLTLKSKIPH